MALVIDIQKKPIGNVKRRKINQTSDVFQLQEIQEVKDATQEHFFMLGLDSKNNITNINLIGVGTDKDNLWIAFADPGYYRFYCEGTGGSNMTIMGTVYD